MSWGNFLQDVKRWCQHINFIEPQQYRERKKDTIYIIEALNKDLKKKKLSSMFSYIYKYNKQNKWVINDHGGNHSSPPPHRDSLPL